MAVISLNTASLEHLSLMLPSFLPLVAYCPWHRAVLPFACCTEPAALASVWCSSPLTLLLGTERCALKGANAEVVALKG